MELRAYLDILSRRRWLVIVATVVVALVAGVTSNLRTPLYRASASVLLRPGDPAEQLSTSTQLPARSPLDADRYLAGQVDIIESERVAAEAAKEVTGATIKGLLKKISADQAGTTDIVRISATDSGLALPHLQPNPLRLPNPLQRGVTPGTPSPASTPHRDRVPDRATGSHSLMRLQPPRPSEATAYSLTAASERHSSRPPRRLPLPSSR